MTNNIWNGSIGNFGSGANWSLHHVKGDDEIDAGDATLGSTPKTVTSLLLGTAGRLTVTGVLTSGAITNHGTIFDWGNLVATSAALTNTGLLEIGRSVAIDFDDVVTTGMTGRMKVASIDNTGVVDLEGLVQGSAPSAVLKVLGAASFGTVGVITGKVELSHSAEIKFASGSFTSIAADGKLSLDGPDAVITTTGGAFSNTTLTTLASNLGTLDLSGGSSIAAKGAFTNSGAIDLEKGDESLSTSLSIAGALTNELGGQITLGGDTKLAGFDKLTITGALNNDGSVDLGSTTLADAVLVTTAAIDNLSTGYLSLVTALPTSSTATIDVASAAGFGTVGVLTGHVYLQGNSTIEFASGQITTIAEFGTLTVDGANAFVADATATTSNSALNVSLINVDGYLELDNGASETSTGGLTVDGDLYVDAFYSDDTVAVGGSTLTVAGALINDNIVDIGATNLLATDTVTVGSLVNDDLLVLTGTAGAGAAILSVGAAAGFGTVGTVTGDVYLDGNSSIEFASGEITTIDYGAYLNLDGDDGFVADKTALGSNSALTGLALVGGTLDLDDGATVSTTGALTVTGILYMDDYDAAKGGSSLTVAGALTNSYDIYVGGDDILTNDTLKVGSLNNDGILYLKGEVGKGEAIVNVGTAADLGTAGTITGSVYLTGNSTLEVASGQFDTVGYYSTLALDGTDAFVSDASALGSNSALNLNQVAGRFELFDGASATSTGNLTVTGELYLDSAVSDDFMYGRGGSTLTIDGALVIDGIVEIGNDDILTGVTVTAASLTVSSEEDLFLAGDIGKGEAVLTVATAADFGTLGVLTGNVELHNNATLEFASGQITSIASDAFLVLDGVDAFIADKATLGSNSALTGLTTVTGVFELDNGASVTTTGALTVTGDVYIDYDSVASIGGSTLTVGGGLTNSRFVDIGDVNIVSNDTVTVASLINTGTLDLVGNSNGGEALLDVTSGVDFEAATGTDDTLTGEVYLTENATLEFAAGQVTTIGFHAELSLDGADAYVADAPTLGSNSALTGLATIGGELVLDDGATITTSGALTIQAAGSVYLDTSTLKGGSSLTVVGALTNDGLLDIGSENLGANDVLTVTSIANATGLIELDGDPGFGEAIVDVGSPAGFGTLATLSGSVELFGNSTVEFTSGQITTIAGGAYLTMSGDDAFIADAATLGSNSALAGLTTIDGELYINDGASITTTGPLTVGSGANVYVDYSATIGGTSLTVGGALINDGDIFLGDYDLLSDDKITVASLNNTNYLQLEGNVGKGETILTVGGPAGFGTAGTVTGSVELFGASEIVFASGSITTIAAAGTLSLSGDDNFIDDTGGAANGALQLTTIAANGRFSMSDDASLSLTGPLANSGLIYLDSQYFEDGKGGTTLTVAGTLTNVAAGKIEIGNDSQTAGDTLAVTTLVNSGYVEADSSSKFGETISGAITNTGTVDDNIGNLTLSGAVSGAGGSLFLGNFSFATTLDLEGAISGQDVDFVLNSSEDQTLILGDVAGFATSSHISSFKAATAGAEEIDVKGFVESSFNVAANVLTLTNAAAATESLTFSGATYTNASFTITHTATDTIIKNA